VHLLVWEPHRLAAGDGHTRLNGPGCWAARSASATCNCNARTCILIPDVTAARAACAGERLRELSFPDELGLRLTASLGLATFEPPAPGVSVADLLAAADRAFYQAKRAGRDCVRIGAVQDSSLTVQIVERRSSRSSLPGRSRGRSPRPVRTRRCSITTGCTRRVFCA